MNDITPLRPDTDLSVVNSGMIPTHDSNKFYVWPEDDTSYMKLIWKHPTAKYPSGFHVLGSRYHPVGDFDRPDIMLPRESVRIYETRNGFRVFFTGRYNVPLDPMFDELDQMGGDRLYSKYARKRRYFAMRVEPKSRPTGYPFAVARLVDQVGAPLPEWEELISYHDQLVNAHHPNAFLV